MNPSVSAGQGMGRQRSGFRDVDGDGNADFVTSSNSNNLVVKHSTIGRTNLLKGVKRPLGATIALSYEQIGNTYQMPNSTLALSEVKVKDGFVGDGVDSLLTSFAYEGGVYNRHERDFYGFGKVISRTHDTGDGAKVYTQVVQTYSTTDYFSKDLLLTERMEDGNGKPYVEKENMYGLRDPENREKWYKPDKATKAADSTQDLRIFPALTQSIQHFFEGGDKAGKSTLTSFIYDQWGRVVSIADEGDKSIKDDDLLATLAYHSVPAKHIMDMPKSIIVMNGGRIYRKREADIDLNTGQVTQIRQFLDDKQAAVHDLKYDPFGNLEKVIRPANAKEQCLEVNYVYDDQVHSYVTKTSNSYGYSSEASYDYAFGQMLSSKDLNRNDVRYTYGEAGTANNRAGRIVLQEDATDAQEFFFGPLGEVLKNVRTIIIPNHDEQTYTTEWSYDTWSRLTGRTYADGEKVEYSYNVGGLLHSMKGKKKGTEYKYVEQLGYDKFEQRVFLHYGNGTKTTYNYEPDRRRLKGMVAKTAKDRAMMDNVY